MLNPSTEETQLYLNPLVREWTVLLITLWPKVPRKQNCEKGQKIDRKTEDDYKNMEQVYEKTISHLHINLLIENITLIKF